jgi:hypothetical protein
MPELCSVSHVDTDIITHVRIPGTSSIHVWKMMCAFVAFEGIHTSDFCPHPSHSLTHYRLPLSQNSVTIFCRATYRASYLAGTFRYQGRSRLPKLTLLSSRLIQARGMRCAILSSNTLPTRSKAKETRGKISAGAALRQTAIGRHLLRDWDNRGRETSTQTG